MKVYHGGTNIVEYPLVAAGRLQLDFGQGFYTTDIKEQAESWAMRMQQIREKPGIVNVYDFDIDKAKTNFHYHHFEHYDNEWLQFIIANRLGSKHVKRYDIIEGGVANDRVIDTVEAYMANMMTLDVALRELSKHQPNNQICITTQKAIYECLEYIESYNLN